MITTPTTILTQSNYKVMITNPTIIHSNISSITNTKRNDYYQYDSDAHSHYRPLPSVLTGNFQTY